MNNNNEEKRKHAADKDAQDVRNENRTGSEGSPDREAENTIPDLDHDGMIGNTGGFYGGTSYLGSNYGPGWNSSETERIEKEYNRQNTGNNFDEGEQDQTGALTDEDRII